MYCYCALNLAACSRAAGRRAAFPPHCSFARAAPIPSAVTTIKASAIASPVRFCRRAICSPAALSISTGLTGTGRGAVLRRWNGGQSLVTEKLIFRRGRWSALALAGRPGESGFGVWTENAHIQAVHHIGHCILSACPRFFLRAREPASGGARNAHIFHICSASCAPSSLASGRSSQIVNRLYEHLRNLICIFPPPQVAYSDLERGSADREHGLARQRAFCRAHD